MFPFSASFVTEYERRRHVIEILDESSDRRKDHAIVAFSFYRDAQTCFSLSLFFSLSLVIISLSFKDYCDIIMTNFYQLSTLVLRAIDSRKKKKMVPSSTQGAHIHTRAYTPNQRSSRLASSPVLTFTFGPGRTTSSWKKKEGNELSSVGRREIPKKKINLRD